MSTPDRDTIDTIEKLLNERRKVLGWLSALAERRADTVPAVYQRVRDDYTAKLDKVQAKLLAASDAVQTLAVDVAGRLADKELALGARRDERAEAELRAAVGEYSEREWDKRRAKHDDEIAVATGERDALLGEVTRLRAVLSEVVETGAPAGDLPEAPMAALGDGLAVVASEASSDTAVVPDADGAVAEPDPPSIADFAPVDDGRDIVPAVDDGASSATTPVTGMEAITYHAPAPSILIQEQAIIAPVEPAQPLAPSFDELAFLKTVVGRLTPLAPPSVPADAAPPVEPGRSIEGRADFALPEPPAPYPDPVPEPRVSQEMTPPRESYFGRPTPRTSEAVKSLKCQECGTLNFPTEWYCERCGGELAAL